MESLRPPEKLFLNMFVIYQMSNLGHMDGSDISAITLSGDNKSTTGCEEYQRCFSTGRKDNSNFLKVRRYLYVFIFKVFQCGCFTMNKNPAGKKLDLKDF